MGMNLAYPKNSKIANWLLMNRVMNKCKASKIASILSNSKCITCREKNSAFDNLFPFNVHISNHFKAREHCNFFWWIISLVRNSNKEKANGANDVSAHMPILCVGTIAIPLKFFLNTSSLVSPRWSQSSPRRNKCTFPRLIPNFILSQQ